MPTMLQDGVTWFHGKMKIHAGRTVTFVRGASEETFTAWVTTERHKVMESPGIAVEIKTRSYKYVTSDLSFTPRKGDVIKETIGSEVREFKVMATPNEPELAWVDHDGTITIVRCEEFKVT